MLGDSKKVVILEDSDRRMFGVNLNLYLDEGYKISSSSCNSKAWKAILVRDDKEQEDE